MSTNSSGQQYEEFLNTKNIRTKSIGRDVALTDIHKKLFPFQRDVTRWACKKGRAAIFLDTGLGKTFIQLEWARLMGERTLIIAPLSVARQTVREAKKITPESRRKASAKRTFHRQPKTHTRAGTYFQIAFLTDFNHIYPRLSRIVYAWEKSNRQPEILSL